MTHAARPSAFQRNIAPYRRQTENASVPKPGVIARLFNVLFDNRQRQAERDVEAYLARTGHRFTDSVEREINEHLFDGGWNGRR